MAVPFLDGFPYFPNAAGGSLRTCAAGTTTNIDTWTTQAGNVANANPIPLDAAGYPQSGGIWLSPGVAYRFFLYDADGALVREEDNVSGGVSGAELTGEDGAEQIGYKAAASGSVATTQAEYNGRRLSAFDFMTPAQIADVKAGTLTQDVAAAINAMGAAAVALLRETLADPYSTIKLRGFECFLPAGQYLTTSATIAWPAGIPLRGEGKFASVIRSARDGNIIQEAPTTGVYNATGSLMSGFGIIGDRTKTNQVGLALLRPMDAAYRDIYIMNVGKDGMVVREGLASHFENITTYYCGGYGVKVMDGVDNWTDLNLNNYPTNNCTFVQCHFGFNDKAGIYMGGDGTSSLGYVNSCRFLNCTAEYNYRNSAEGTGQNVEDYSNSYFGNNIDNCWFESPSSGTGAVKYHILKTAAGTGAILYLNGVKHAANGATSYPERYVCVTVGTVLDYMSQGTGNLYRTVAGSNAPFRLTKATARIDVTDPVGSNVTGNLWVEDETGATTGLYDNARIDVFGALYGPSSHRTDSIDVGFEQYRTGDAHPFFRLSGDRTLQLGSGSAAPDVSMSRTAANVVSMGTGDSLALDGTHDGGTLRLRGYYLWVDATGDLRIKSSAPTSDTDGTVVGTQS